jgi:hypothetical protein
MKYIDMLFGKSAEVLNVKAGGTHRNHCASKG